MAVVISFVFCYSPFHAQRVLAVNIVRHNIRSPLVIDVYTILTYISGVTYYLSATINPILYQLMSRKFRIAFKDTFGRCIPCLEEHQSIPEVTYSAIMSGTANSLKLHRSGSSYGNGSVCQSNTQFNSSTSIRCGAQQESTNSKPKYSSSCTNLLELPKSSCRSPSTGTSLCPSPTRKERANFNNNHNNSSNFLTVPVTHV